MNKKITIAIDGHSACGKSTLAKGMAAKLNYVFIDSGAMYRGAALFALRNGCLNPELDKNLLLSLLDQLDLSFKNVKGTNCLFLGVENIEDEIRQPHVAAIVSKVATIKEVRVKLVAQQQEMGANGGIVMDGRDIGSVVFPNAELKLFVTASTAIRSKRRFLELQGKGINQDIGEVEKNLIERDYIDSTREESPLIQVEDAIVLDNSELSKEEQLDWALSKAFDTIQPSSSI
ncbi:(d)CMP kinase [Crocinitomicaceae bacterium]|nr:(d)CMP kinase [Crocinitomicaceae bacterium]